MDRGVIITKGGRREGREAEGDRVESKGEREKEEGGILESIYSVLVLLDVIY